MVDDARRIETCRPYKDLDYTMTMKKPMSTKPAECNNEKSMAPRHSGCGRANVVFGRCTAPASRTPVSACLTLAQRSTEAQRVDRFRRWRASVGRRLTPLLPRSRPSLRGSRRVSTGPGREPNLVDLCPPTRMSGGRGINLASAGESSFDTVTCRGVDGARSSSASSGRLC